jgi:hypothetical protein
VMSAVKSVAVAVGGLPSREADDVDIRSILARYSFHRKLCSLLGWMGAAGVYRRTVGTVAMRQGIGVSSPRW